MLAAVPAFDPDDTKSLIVGINDDGFGVGTTRSSTGLPQPHSLLTLDELPINQPDEYTLTDAKIWVRGSASRPCDRLTAAVMWTPDSGGARQYPSAAVPATILLVKVLYEGASLVTEALRSYSGLTDLLDLSAFTFTNKTLWWGIELHKPETPDQNYQASSRVTATEGNRICPFWGQSDIDLGLSAKSPGDTIAVAMTQKTLKYLPMQQLRFATKARTVQVRSGLSLIQSKDYPLARFADAPTVIALKGITAAEDGDTGVSMLRISTDLAHSEVGGVTLDFDAGTVGFGAGAARATYPMGDGITKPLEEHDDDKRDLMIGLRFDGAAVKSELFDQNRTTDKKQGPQAIVGEDGVNYDAATFAHGSKRSGVAREQDITLTDAGTGTMLPCELRTITGATAGSCTLEVGREPRILLGDSRAGQLVSTADGNLVAKFTHRRIEWNASVSGNEITDDIDNVHTAMCLRYKHTIPGLGDICDMLRFGAILGIDMPFVNDAAQELGAGATDEDAQGLATAAAGLIGDIIDDVQATRAEYGAGEITLATCPRWAAFKDPPATAARQAAIDYYNIALRALAIAELVTCTDAAAVCASNEELYYRAIDGVHLNDAGDPPNGASLIAKLLADGYQVGGLPEITATAETGGSIVTSLPDPYYLAYGGDVTAITAKPNVGYILGSPHWTGDVPTGQERDNPIILTNVTDDLDLQAVFSEISSRGGLGHRSPLRRSRRYLL